MNNEINNGVQENAPTNESPAHLTSNEPISTTNFTSDESSKKRKGFNKGFLIFIILLLAIIAGIYWFICNNPKNIFLRAINNEYNKFDEFIEENIDENISDKAMTSTAILNFDVKASDEVLDEETKALLDEINKLNLTLNTGIDYKHKQLLVGLDAKQNTNSLLNMMVYGNNESIYLELKNLFDKYIEIPVEDYQAIFESEDDLVDNSRYVIDSIKNAVLDNMQKKDFKTSKEDIVLDTKKVKTKKITYTLTEKIANTLLIDVLTDLKGDSKFIESLSTLVDTDKEDVKDEIESMIDELKTTEDFDDETVIELSVYTKGLSNEAVQYEITIKSDDESGSMVYSDYAGIKHFQFIENGETIISLVNEKNKDNEYVTTLTMSTVKLIVNSNKSNDSWKHTYTLTEEDSDVEFRGEVTISTKEVTKDKEYTNDFKFSLGMGLQGEEDMMTITATVTGENKVVDQLSIPSLDNSVLYTDLTEADMNKIQTNIMSNPTLADFINKIAELTASSNDDYDYDYDYEF